MPSEANRGRKKACSNRVFGPGVPGLAAPDGWASPGGAPGSGSGDRAPVWHYLATHPLPDLDRWRAIRDPRERLRTGLTEAYAYHRWTEAMMTHVLAEARDHPVMAPYHAYWRRAVHVLAAGWGLRGRRKELLCAGIGLAVGFDAWRALVREQGLSDAAAVELMLRLAEPSAT